MATEDQDETGEAEALKAMLQSDGWRFFSALVAKEWGPIVALEKIYAGQSQELVKASHLEVSSLMQAPIRRILALRAPQVSANPLQALRRLTR